MFSYRYFYSAYFSYHAFGLDSGLDLELLPTSDDLGPLSGYRDERFVADFLGTKVETLRTWRKRGCGPPWYKLGSKLVRYRLGEVVGWANSQPGQAA
jgi:hypothetical protein